MKEENDALLLPRSKSDLKEEMMGAGDSSIYSPTRKAARGSEVVSRVHCIPVLMLFVFFVLWAASSEVNGPELHLPARAKAHLKSSEVHLKVIDSNGDSVALPDSSRTVDEEESDSSHHDVNDEVDVGYSEVGRDHYIRGNAR